MVLQKHAKNLASFAKKKNAYCSYLRFHWFLSLKVQSFFGFRRSGIMGLLFCLILIPIVVKSQDCSRPFSPHPLVSTTDLILPDALKALRQDQFVETVRRAGLEPLLSSGEFTLLVPPVLFSCAGRNQDLVSLIKEHILPGLFDCVCHLPVVILPGFFT